MKANFGGLVALGLVGVAVLSGCGSAAEEAPESESKLVADEEAVVCNSVRDDKTYPVGTTLVGKHDSLRCPASTKICLAPDSNYSSECRADGSWAVTDTGSFVEPHR